MPSPFSHSSFLALSRSLLLSMSYDSFPSFLITEACPHSLTASPVRLIHTFPPFHSLFLLPFTYFSFTSLSFLPSISFFPLVVITPRLSPSHTYTLHSPASRPGRLSTRPSSSPSAPLAATGDFSRLLQDTNTRKFIPLNIKKEKI